MKPRRTIWLLQIITFSVLISLLVWQFYNLPNLRFQIKSGLHNSLQKIAESGASGLEQGYSDEVLKGFKFLQAQIPLEQFRPNKLDDMKIYFRIVSSSQQLCNAWFIALPNYDYQRFRVYEYKAPSRYRPDTDVTGSWRKDTDLSDFIQSELNKVLAPYQTLDSFAKGYWSTAVDSNLLFIYNRSFTPTTIIGAPVFDSTGKHLKAFFFNQTDPWYLENVFIRDYFNNQFQAGSSEWEGIGKKYLQVGVFSGKGDRLIYNSVAYGRKEFEHMVPITGVNSWLPDFKIGVGFRNSNVEQVGNSIYERNRNLVYFLFLTLVVLVALLFRSARQLVKLSKLRTEFVANVSHEIKTPLASIRLAADTLKLARARTEEQRQTVVSIISKETDRLQYLVETLLDFSQLEAGKKKYRWEELSVQEWWDLAVQFAKEKYNAYLGEISGEPKDQRMKLDRRALEQVVNILMDNAVKYSPNEKRIDLRLKPGKGNDRVRIEVKDYGMGIAKENQALVFDKFVRIGKTDVHDIKGHGIGLSIAKAIVRDHGGRIGVESQLGKGSTFYFELPLLEKKESNE